MFLNQYSEPKRHRGTSRVDQATLLTGTIADGAARSFISLSLFVPLKDDSGFALH